MNENNQPVTKKLKLLNNNGNTELLIEFQEWLKKENFELSSNVQITNDGPCARFGIIALDDISCGDVILSIPRDCILWERNCSIFSHLQNCKLNDNSGWVKLILCLMYEYTNSTSRWRPYMRFVPPITVMDQPLFWSSKQLSLLKDTGLHRDVMDDMKRISEEYHEVALPFIIKHKHLGFDDQVHTLDLYKHMAAFVMAYSFTEPSEDDESFPPMMVPLADALNHVSANNACLEFEPDRLVMKAISDIRAGSEVYNTYGQLSNAQLLQMYGFVEPFPNNVYDTVDIEMTSLFTSIPKLVSCADAKLKWLFEERNLPTDYPIVLGVDGFLTVPEFKLITKILPMSEEEFSSSEWQEDEDWDTDDDEEEEDQEFEVFSYKKIKQLDSDIKSCLRGSLQPRLNELKRLLSEQHPDTPADPLEESRISRSLTLIHGQQKIIELLMKATEE